jgi:hypothetical protein
MRQRDDRLPSSAHLNPPALEREVEPARPWLRRGRNQLLLVAACLAVIAASAGLVWWKIARLPLVLEIQGEPHPTPARAIQEELATAALAADEAIGAAVTGDVDDDPNGWRGVAASPDRFGVVALWSDRELWVSRDDGRTFRQELAASERIGAAAVGHDGRVYLARHGGHVGVLTPSGRTVWTRLDYQQALAVAHGGTWTVLLALGADRHDGLSPLLWITADHGATWRRLVAPAAGDLDNALRVTADGTIDLLVRVTGDLAPRIRHYRGHVDGRPFGGVVDTEDPQPFGLGHDGQMLHLAWTADDVRLEPAHLPVRDWDVVVGAGPGRTLAVSDRHLRTVQDGRATALSDDVPGRVRALAADGIGRSLAIIGRAGLRNSERHGWRRLFELADPNPRVP